MADTGNHRVRRIDASGIINTVVGDGTAASSGEGEPAQLQALRSDVHSLKAQLDRMEAALAERNTASPPPNSPTDSAKTD